MISFQPPVRYLSFKSRGLRELVLLAPTADLNAMPIEDKQKRDLSHTPDRERSTRASPILTPRGGEWHPTSVVRLLEWLTPTCHVSSSTEQQKPAAFAGGRRLFLRSPVSLRSTTESGGTWALPPQRSCLNRGAVAHHPLARAASAAPSRARARKPARAG